jgi:acetyl esterase/lipase
MAGKYPPVDAQAAAALAALGPWDDEGLTADQIPAVRELRKSVRLTDADLRRGGAIEFEELTVPGPAGAPDIGLLVCRPAGLTTPAAGVYHIHGGGMVLGDNRSVMPVMLNWIEQVGVIVVSVEYRLAPEHPYPAPVEDCFAGLEWTAAHAAELGIEPGRLLIAGASAGGGLAAAVALLARDRGGPALIGQMLGCPMLDDRNQTPSSYELDHEGTWDRTSNLTGWRALLGDAQGGQDVPPYAAPARATDLSGLPPAYLDVGSVEIFRDEILDYAARIWRSGGAAELHVWPGGFHGFESLAPDAAISMAARQTRIGWLRRLLADAAVDPLAQEVGVTQVPGVLLDQVD